MSLDWLRTKLPDVNMISERLKAIISREVDTNGYILREIGAKTIFVMLYSFCVDGQNWVRPATVTCMTDEQALISDESKRNRWLDTIQGKKAPKDIQNRWYMPNTRECIRDETIREMVRIGAVVEREGIATTSPTPRYTLQRQFAELFNPDLHGTELEEKIKKWQEDNLSAASLARIALSKRMVTAQGSGVLITLPNGETRKLSPGPSSELAKAVVEIFSKNFLKDPAAILVSESARKIVVKDDELCRAIGFNIDVSTVLPDIIMVDMGRHSPLIVFVECVATDGPINDRRKQELLEIAGNAGYSEKDCAFVTVFKDRVDQVSRKLNPSIAWGTFIWYATEPDSIVYFYKGKEHKLTYIVDILALSEEI